MNSTKRDQYADQKIDVEEVIGSHSNLVKKIAFGNQVFVILLEKVHY